MFDCCIINIGWLTLLVDSFYSSCSVTCFLCNTHSIHLDTYYFIIVAYSTYFDVLIVLLDYSHSMLTSSHYLIFYLILYMYTLIFAYFICHDLVNYIGRIFYQSMLIPSYCMITLLILTHVHLIDCLSHLP